MKKTAKKISGLLKVTLLLGMIFSQLASPVRVLADQVVPSYNLDIELDTKNDDVIDNDEFVVISNGTQELVGEDNYILEIVRSFMYYDEDVIDDANINTTYVMVTGNDLTAGVVLPHEVFNYNGISYVSVNVYEINTDETIDMGTYTEEGHLALLEAESIAKIMDTSFEEGVTYNDTSLTFNVLGESILCDTTDGHKCNVTLNDIDNKVEIDYTLKTGDLNPNKDYHIILKVNGVASDLVTGDISVNEKLVIDISNLLPGVYNLEYEVRDEDETEVISGNLEITYTNDEITDKIDFIENAMFSEEVFYSYTTLSDLEKETLGYEYEFLDTPLAFIFDNVVSTNDIHVNYNLYDEDCNRYHVVTSDRFVGAFSEEFDEGAYKVGEVLEALEANMIEFSEISIVDSEGQVVSDDVYVQNGMKLVVNIIGETLEYDFLVYADVDGSFVEDSDISALVDKVLNSNISYYDTYNFDLNGDEVVDAKDISILGANIGLQQYEISNDEVVDTLVTIIESNTDELYVSESFEVVLSLDGFAENYINAIEGFVNYDDTALSLDSVEVLNEDFVGNNLDNRLIYATSSTYATNNEGFIKLTFTALTAGVHTVSVDDIALISDGIVVTTAISNELEITVNRALHTDASLKSLTSSIGWFNKTFDSEILEYTLYVDSSVSRVTLSGEVNDEYATTDDFKEYVLTGDNTMISVNVTAEDGTVRTYKVNVVKVYKSSNNNLVNIIVEGYDIDFDKDTLEYKITVDSDVDSLNISAYVEHFGAWAKIEGNENFKEGENTVTITVYAEDGSEKVYKLLINKKAKEKVDAPVVDDEDDKNSVNTEKLVIIILIILVVIGLLYLILKKDEDEEPRIEQIKPKKDVVKEPKKEEVKNNNNNHKNKHKGKK